MSIPEDNSPPDYNAYTDRVIDRCLVEAHATHGMAESEDITHTVRETASNFCEEIHNKTPLPEHLTAWHRSVRKQCSNRYQALLQQNPSGNRQKLNEDLKLQQLNAVQKGLRIAVRESYAGTRRKPPRTIRPR